MYINSYTNSSTNSYTNSYTNSSINKFLILFVIISLFIFGLSILIYNFYKNFIKSITPYKIALYQYNRLNNQDFINRNPFNLLVDDFMENSYAIIDKII